MAVKLRTDLILNTGPAQAAIKGFQTASKTAFGSVGRAARGLNRIVDGLKGSFRSAGSVAAGFLGAQAIIGGAKAAGRFIQSLTTDVGRLGDEAAKTADKLGVGVEALQELRFAAGRAGIEANTFDVALQRFTRRSAEAAAGTGEAKAALQQLGIQLKDSNGNLRPSEDLLGDVADAFKGVESQSDRVRLAFKLFDTEGVQLVNLLQRGSGELNEFREQAKRFGVVTEEQARQSERFADAQQDLSAAFQGVAITIGGQLLPIITPLINRFAEFLSTGRSIIPDVLDKMFVAFKILSIPVKFIARLILGLGEALSNLGGFAVDAVNGFLEFRLVRFVVDRVADAFKFLANRFLDFLGILAKLPGVGRAFGGLLDDIKNLNKGLDSVAKSGDRAGRSLSNVGLGGGEAPSGTGGLAAPQQRGLSSNQLASAVFGAFKQGGQEGALAIAAQIATVAPPLAQAGLAAAQFLAQGGEQVRMQLTSFLESLPDLIINISEGLAAAVDVLIERSPLIIDRIIQSLPQIIENVTPAIGKSLAAAAANPLVSTAIAISFVRAIPSIIAGFVTGLKEAAGEFVQTLISQVSGAGDIAGIGGGGGGGGFLGNLLGFADGGEVPNISQFQNDGAIARVSAGENIIDRSTNDALKRFLAQGGGSAPQQITVQAMIDTRVLAEATVDMKRQGLRTEP